MKTLSVIILLVFFQSNLDTLKKKKTDIYRYRFSHKSRPILFVDTPGSKVPSRVINGQRPDNIQCLYNVLPDSSGKIICISKILYKDNVDGEFTYTSYFDERGKTFAFDRVENIYLPADNLKDNLARDIDSKYFDSNFKIIDQQNRLIDGSGEPINKNKFRFPYYNYIVYKNLADCLKAYHIKL